jgi:transcriptional regulator with XRE-family HTH domain
VARRHRVLNKPSGLRELPASAPRELSKIEFGRRLNQLLLERDWTQSDLARQAFGETTDTRGYKVPKNREVISSIINGKSFPSPLNLRRIAKALGMEEDKLLPNVKKMAIDAEKERPAFEFKVATGHPNEGWLQINQLVSYDTFVKIAALLKGDKIE